MDEQQLMDLLKGDPSQGMLPIISQYGGLVRHIVAGILPAWKQQDIEDLVSTVFANLWEHRDNLSQSKGSIKSYLAASARNAAINCLRKNGGVSELLPLEENLIGISFDLEDQVYLRERKEQLYQVLREMNELDREIFIRRYFYLQRIKEISLTVNLDCKAVENRLYRGRLRLKEKLRERGVFNESMG